MNVYYVTDCILNFTKTLPCSLFIDLMAWHNQFFNVLFFDYGWMFFASENSSLLQKVFPRHRWGIFMLT
jgi:regulatory protein YycH of two-component signal transduction system YycFG